MASTNRSKDGSGIKSSSKMGKAGRSSAWHPAWWNDHDEGGSWERVKAAVVRDWEQTKKDLHLGGKDLHQEISDTVKQAAGKERIPEPDESNPAKVLGTLRDDELPIGYGYGARMHYGESYRQWDPDLEDKLRMEWEGSDQGNWDEVRERVKYGFEYKH